MKQEAYGLSSAQARGLVRDAIVGVCRFRSWRLLALHVRPTHVHGLVDADTPSSAIVNSWKSYATRALRASRLVESDRRIWAHSGNVRIIKPDGVAWR